MRKARSVAWFSTAGFHQRSKWITCDAAVRFSPVPPAFSDSTKNGGPSRPGSARRVPAAFDARPAVEHQPGPAEDAARNAASGAVDLAELREDEHLLLPRGDLLGELASRRTCRCRSGSYSPSPSHCDGWLQICFRRMRVARIVPRRSMPSIVPSRCSSSFTVCAPHLLTRAIAGDRSGSDRIEVCLASGWASSAVGSAHEWHS